MFVKQFSTEFLKTGISQALHKLQFIDFWKYPSERMEFMKEFGIGLEFLKTGISQALYKLQLMFQPVLCSD
jgi:hypothetical protein